MKKILTLLLSFCFVAAIAQTNEPASGNNQFDGSPRAFTEISASFVPSPGIEPVIPPDATRELMGVILYTDRAVFNTNYPGLPVEGFENSSIADGSIESFPSPLDEFTNNAYFVPGDILPGIQISTVNSGNIAILGKGASTNTSKIALPDAFNDGERVLFNPPVKSVGFDVHDFITSPNQCQIDVYDAQGSPIGTYFSSATIDGVFWGLHSDVPIGEVVIFTQNDSGEGVDNIAFGDNAAVVPVSNWAIVLGVLLISAFIVVRYRTRMA